LGGFAGIGLRAQFEQTHADTRRLPDTDLASMIASAEISSQWAGPSVGAWQ
jgi:hypothetical protein